jgi:serine phosphatase RsbU (regulator of sigma subunit)
MSATFTSDFRHEFEAEQERWLRRRFLWYAGVVIGFGLVSTIILVVALAFLGDEPGVTVDRSYQSVFQAALSLVSILLYVAAFAYVYKHLLRRDKLLQLVFRLIVAAGLLSILTSPLVFELSRDQIRQQMERSRRDGTPVVGKFGPGIQVSVDEDKPPVPADPPAIDPASDSPKPAAEDGEDADVDTAASAAPSPVTDQEVDKQIARMIVAGNSLGSIFLTHFFACLFLPWTPRESIRPIIPLLIASAVINLYYIRLVPVGAGISIVLSPLTAVPGALICWWRQGRFKDKFTFQMLKGRYGEIKQELTSAKQIHESLFPRPLADGPIRMDYRYEPMRMIGGDYLYARSATLPGHAQPILNIALIDVTGHGITAALTVNRLHGEIDRQYGEKPSATPGEILTGLNKYLHHSLATHSVYATALCVQFDPNSSTMTWASAGHPPAFFRTVDGKIDRIESTTLVLGACHGDDFQHGERLVRFGPGDTLVAYTDGAIEARDNKGKMLKVAGMERLLASLVPDDQGGWSSAILRAVDQYRHGPPEDDTLLVEVWRPVR